MIRGLPVDEQGVCPGVSESTFVGTRADGTRIEARMVDVFTFRDGKIALKNAFRKDRPPLPTR